jgi:hypothetical protein
MTVLLLVLSTACQGQPVRRDPDRTPATTSVTPPPSATPAGSAIVASSFEGQVCGRYHADGGGPCEFGVEGEVVAGTFDCRTGAGCVQIQRMASGSHMGVIADVPLPDGHAFIGVSHRVPEVPAGAIPDDPGYLQLEQLSPTDGSLAAWPVEVRLYPDRTLGLALFQGSDVARTHWQVPVDRWFSIVVEVSHGLGAVQRMWVYDEDDLLAERVSFEADTELSWAHAHRTAQKVGGTVSTRIPLFTYADDWYIAASSLGPARVDPEGALLVP